MLLHFFMAFSRAKAPRFIQKNVFFYFIGGTAVPHCVPLSAKSDFIRLFSKQILYDFEFFIGLYQISTQKLRAFQHLHHAPIKVRVFHRF